MKQVIDVSIVVELENCSAHINEFQDNLLSQLLPINDQIAEIDYHVEVLVCFSKDAMDDALLEKTKNLCFQSMPQAQLKFLSFNCAGYYQLKNDAAEYCLGDIIIFLDSDVSPNHDWLKQLLEPFEKNKDIKVIAGRTELNAKNRLQRGQQLVTFFDNFKEAAPLSSVNTFFANNAAFKKEIFLSYKFPINDSSARSSCVQLSNTLTQNNILIWKQHRAVVLHRAVMTLSELFIRCIAEGRDYVVRHDQRNPSIFKRAYLPIKLYKQKLRLVMNNLKQTSNMYDQSPMPWVSILIAYSYVHLLGVSSTLTLIFPKIMRSIFLKI